MIILGKQRKGECGTFNFLLKNFQCVYLLSNACWRMFTLALLCMLSTLISPVMLANYVRRSLSLILPMIYARLLTHFNREALLWKIHVVFTF